MMADRHTYHPASVSSRVATVLVLLAVLLTGLPAAEAAEDGDIRITVHSSSVINDRLIVLGDIAAIEGPSLVQEVLAGITIGYGPDLGEIKIVDGRRIESKINAFRNLPEGIQVRVPDSVYIKRESQEISEDRLRQLFVDQVETLLDTDDYSIREFNIRGLSLFPGGRLELSPQPQTRGTPVGRVSLAVTVIVDGEVEGEVFLSAWVDVFDSVLCATRNLRRGETLAAGDCRIERKNISRFSGDWISAGADVLGMALKRSVRQGRPISMAMLDSPPLVKSGDRVTLVATTGDLKIVTAGIARDDGKLNQQVRVENMTSRRDVYGVVIGEGTVEVIY